MKVERFEDPTWAALIDNDPDNDWFGYCIGDTQYSYRLNTQLVADGGKTEPQPPNQADQAFIITELCNPTDLTDANPDHPDLRTFDTVPDDTTKPETLGTQPPERFELLHDRMRVLGFSVDQVGDHEDLYDIRLKLAVGGDATEPLYEVEIFEFIEPPCTPPSTLARWNLGLVFDEAACQDASNEWEPVSPGMPIMGAGTWSDPATLLPKGEDDLPHYDPSTTLPRVPPALATQGVVKNREVIINKCQGAATLCAVMETRTRVFRRVF